MIDAWGPYGDLKGQRLSYDFSYPNDHLKSCVVLTIRVRLLCSARRGVVQCYLQHVYGQRVYDYVAHKFIQFYITAGCLCRGPHRNEDFGILRTGKLIANQMTYTFMAFSRDCFHIVHLSICPSVKITCWSQALPESISLDICLKTLWLKVLITMTLDFSSRLQSSNYTLPFEITGKEFELGPQRKLFLALISGCPVYPFHIKTSLVLSNPVSTVKNDLSRVMRKQTFWIPTRFDTNQAVQLQKMARGLKFRIKKAERSCYLRSENKGTDQLRGYREADLRLCFRICKTLVFS